MQAVREAMREAHELEAQQNFEGDDEGDEMQDAGEALHTENQSLPEAILENSEPKVGVCVLSIYFPVADRCPS